MNDTVIKAEKLGKKYIIGHQSEQERYTALRDVVSRTAKGLARTAMDMIHGKAIVPGDALEEFWALKDVNFEIKRGEVVGIIGRNGAGKSTLLKVLSRITEPSEGKVTIKGRVASLLEVGTGFHPELTGRENIYLNGAILGMTRAEIKRKFDEIVDFAEVERFLDTPVKRYSSGMYVRLAFAVAAHLEPEILIIDEVLAVGDAEFQKKCIGKMQNVASRGRTVLFVSHSMATVVNLCTKIYVLENGFIGYKNTELSKAISYYISSSDKKNYEFRYLDNMKLYSDNITIHNICINGKQHGVINLDDSDGIIDIVIDIESRKKIECELEIRIEDLMGNKVAFFSAWRFGGKLREFFRRNELSWKIGCPSIRSGLYRMHMLFTIPNVSVISRIDDIRVKTDGKIRGKNKFFSHVDAGLILLGDLS